MLKNNKLFFILVAAIILFTSMPKQSFAADPEPEIFIESAKYYYVEGVSLYEQYIVSVASNYVSGINLETVNQTSQGGIEYGVRNNGTVTFRCNGTIRVTVTYYVDGVEQGVKNFTVASAGIKDQPSYCAVPPGEDDPPIDPPIDPKDSINGDGTEAYEDYDGSKEKARQEASNDGSGSGSGDGSGDGSGSGSGDGSGDGSGSGSCDSCAVFSCPGWDEYMGKLDGIKGAIPPAPNWDEVAATFRDTIVPKVIGDLENLLGYAPEPPSAPTAPTPPAMPIDLDDGGIKPPTGQEAPGLEESTFDEDDIKNEAPVIPEREDPTGGFEINDPIEGLPSQDEFKENIPNEGSAPLPGEPKEPENIAPKPPEVSAEAPVPTEPTNEAPTPSEPSGEAPTPSDNTGAAPIPNESGTAPMPGDSFGGYPIPNESGTAPIPSGW